MTRAAIQEPPANPSSTLAQTQNLNVIGTRPIPTPRELEQAIPATGTSNGVVIGGREAIRQILGGQDKRLLTVVGPCSVHDVDAARDYAERLAKLKAQVEDRLLIVMRVYFEKPRTTVGWKGLINDPHLDGSFDMATGLKRARQLLLDVNELGLPCATELLDPIIPQYIDDFVAWAAIGARTTESQTHRQMASGLSMPVGYKNSTDGNLQIAIDAFKSARSGHHFLGIDEDGRNCIVQTRGNADGHVILRGGGKNGTNYDPENVRVAASLLAKAGLPPRLMVDCSHANSGKKHENQASVYRSVVEQRRSADCPIVGVMLESFIEAGRQDVGENPATLTYGQSITDACIGWDETERLLTSLA